ncbi:MAG: HAD hydrolase-like protein [Clostridiales bacterium]|nr:HAD hydrolase-like protein [Clostridiales bacterium]
MYSYVFFDLDGTLTQSEFGILEGARRALSHFGIDTSDEKKLKKFIGPPLHVSFHDNYGLSEEDTEEAISIYRAYYRAKGIYQAPLYEGMFALLSDLKNAGRKLMITTSKPLVMAEKVAKNNEIYDLFDGIIGPGLDEKDASKTWLIRRAMEELGVSDADREKVVMVGDRFYDIEGACEASVDSIGVLYGYGEEEELRGAGATHIAADVPALRELLLDGSSDSFEE